MIDFVVILTGRYHTTHKGLSDEELWVGTRSYCWWCSPPQTTGLNNLNHCSFLICVLTIVFSMVKRRCAWRGIRAISHWWNSQYNTQWFRALTKLSRLIWMTRIWRFVFCFNIKMYIFTPISLAKDGSSILLNACRDNHPKLCKLLIEREHLDTNTPDLVSHFTGDSMFIFGFIFCLHRMGCDRSMWWKMSAFWHCSNT